MRSGLLAIDPGVKILGWALFVNRELYRCGLSISDLGVPHCLSIHERNLRTLGVWAEERVCERMVQRGKMSAVRTSDLLDVQLVAGSLGDVFYTPQEWKGSVPRKKEQERTKKVLAAGELALLRYVKEVHGAEAHNAWSAVGIGLHHLGRGLL